MRTYRPMHVLVSAYSCRPDEGSEAGIGWNWVHSLSRLCRVTVITREVNRQAIERWLRGTALPSTRFHYIDAPAGFRSWSVGKLYYGMWQRRTLALARGIHAADPFDVVHHVTVASINYPIFLQRLPVPLVYGPVGGGESVPAPLRIGNSLTEAGYEAARSLRQRLVPWNPRIRAILRGARIILVANEETLRLVPMEWREKSDVMSMVGADTAEARHAPRTVVDTFQIYMAGRMLHWKGLHLGVRAFAEVAELFPEYRMVLVGDGPQRGRLEQLVRDLSLEERVVFRGWLPRSETLEIARDSRLLLFPSLRDSGGMAVIEAMAQGTPVLCLAAGGPASIVSPESGVVVPVHSEGQVVSDLAAALHQLLGDSPRLQRMGEAASRRAATEFAWDRRASRMLALYERILSEKNRR